MRGAIVVDGEVRNVVLFDPGWKPEEGVVIETDTAEIGWSYVDGAFIAPPAPEPEPPPRRYVRKLLILDRLSDAGLFDAAFAALGGPGEVGYERWQAASEIAADDAQVRGLLTAIGADPDVILAPE